MKLVLLGVLVLGLSGCYLEDREAFRPEPTEPDVMAQLQATADENDSGPISVAP